jgi:hypothetical protein
MFSMIYDARIRVESYIAIFLASFRILEVQS